MPSWNREALIAEDPFAAELAGRECELCGERIGTAEAGEFASPNGSVLAHAECGLAAGLEIA